jgi:hypothetical protein
MMSRLSLLRGTPDRRAFGQLPSRIHYVEADLDLHRIADVLSPAWIEFLSIAHAASSLTT